MTEEDKILRFIGLAMRAGKVVSGFDATVSAMRAGQCRLLILSKDISANTLNKLMDRASECDDDQLTAYSFATARQLGDAIGRPDRAVLAITDQGFATKLAQMIEETDNTKEIC